MSEQENASGAQVPCISSLDASREAFLNVWNKDSFEWTPDGTFGTHNWQATCWEIWKRGVQFGASNTESEARR